MLNQSISKNSILLGMFALITAVIVAGTFQTTRARIELEEKKSAEKALLEIVPKARHNNDILTDVIAIPTEQLSELGLSQAADIHVARHQGNVIAVILPLIAPDGYSGDIKLIVGINLDQTIAGVRVLSHRETPGLGDKIQLQKSRWILDFENTSLAKPAIDNWKVKKDGGQFDQFTGATITPRAVVQAVKNALVYFQQHRDWIIAHTRTDRDSEGE